MTIGLYGGSFNPPHLGHLVIAESVREQRHFDSILFVPSATTPNKMNAALASAADRLQMTQLAVQGNSGFEVSDIEVRRQGVSYTIDTITDLVTLRPHATFELIIGTDNLMEFETWKSPGEILARVGLVVVNRPGFPQHGTRPDLVRRAVFVNVPQIGISSTDIRRRIKLGRSIRYLVPREVEEYIERRKLYRD